MSALTARSALVLQLAQLDATQCGSCSHPLSLHLPKMPRGGGCHEWHIVNGSQKFCKCARFVEPSEQLPIGGDKK